LERLGDVRSRAVTMGKIADILQARGQLDEALKIRNEEQLPVYERLGDVHSRAVTMGKIADILQARGQLDKALKIRNEEELPVYERLGDMRSHAVTMGQIADILHARGQLDEALKILEEQLPVYERLGDVRSRAVTMGKIAEILQASGQLDEALTMHSGRLVVAEAMADIDSVAHIKFNCATIRLERGGWEKGEAEAIVAELAESFTIARKIGRTDFIAGIGVPYGRVLAAGGHPDDALAVLDEAAGAFEKLERKEDVARVRALQDQLRAMSTGGSSQPVKGHETG
jgi:phosphopentomutase